jgi:DNA-binding transcriptional MerR regulator
MRPKTLTVSGLARAAGVSEGTVRQYSRRKLIPYSVDSAGRRLFDESAIPMLRAVFAERVAARGRRSRT